MVYEICSDVIFFFKQKTAYEMRISDWSSDVCSSDLRAYFHHKSADWKANKPFRLAGWTAEELAKMPTYYIMDWADDMAQGVAKEAPSPAEVAACKWLTEDELRVYSGEYGRIGFQGGLQWYRCRTLPWPNAELNLFAGRTIEDRKSTRLNSSH